MKRKFLIAPSLALVLLIPGTPAPTRAGTFEFALEAPFIIVAEVFGASTIRGAACVDADAADAPWIALTLPSADEIEGYTGATAKLKDKPDKFKAKFGDKAKTAGSGDIQRLEIDSSGDPDVGTIQNVKATLKAKVTEYLVDPAELTDALNVTFAKLKVNDKTNGEKVTIDANLAVKVTEKGTCSQTFDEAGKATGLQVTDASGRRTVNLRLVR